MGFFQLRGIADRVVQRKQFAFLRKLWRDWSPGWQFSDEDFQPVIDAFSQPGVVRGALGYYRAIPGAMPLRRAAREETRWTIDVPTLAITGADDGCIDTDVFQALMYAEDFPKGLQVEQVANAGHFPHTEQTEAVNKLLLDWFEAHAGRAIR
jgi:pimeloyl-ACP methyl ester carboxylesterase